jgi:hypothetical protein
MTSEQQLESLFEIEPLAIIVKTRLSDGGYNQASLRRRRHENYVEQDSVERDILGDVHDDSEIEALAKRGVLQSWIDADEMRELTIEELGQYMPEFVDGPMLYATKPKYWSALKREFRRLVCTNDKRYSTLKARLNAAGSKSQLTLVSTIAVAVSAHVGVAAGVLVPFCSLCLIALVKLGKEAFCDIQQLDLPLSGIKKDDDPISVVGSEPDPAHVATAESPANAKAKGRKSGRAQVKEGKGN